MKKVAIIGAGLGGLSAACYLSSLGFETEIFEKNSEVGGKLSEIRSGEYFFDGGPTLLTMPFVVEEVLSFAGVESSDYLKLIEIDPIARNFFPNGKIVDTSPIREKAAREFEKLHPDDGRNYLNFMARSERLYTDAAGVFLFEPFHEIKKLYEEKSLPSIATVFKIDAFRTMHSRNSVSFSSPEATQLMDRFATYNGSDPYKAPATLNIIPHVEYDLKSYYVRGGMFQIAKILSKTAENRGTKINLNREVEEIVVKNNKFSGVKVEGEVKEFDYCVCNSDSVYSFDKLIPGFERRTERLKKLEPSLSGALFLWGVSEEHENLAAHNVFFSSDYKEEFRRIFEDKLPPEDPTIYVSISSKLDSTRAPEGRENWYVLLNMPYLDDIQSWELEKEKIREKILKKLLIFGFDVAGSIESETILTPPDFAKRFNSNRGSIYGLSSNSPFSAFLRPPNRSRKIENLYFASGSAHPGGGIPLATLSGRHCASLIAYKEKIPFEGK